MVAFHTFHTLVSVNDHLSGFCILFLVPVWTENFASQIYVIEKGSNNNFAFSD